MSFSVLDLLRYGNNFSWHHVGETTLPDGKKTGVQSLCLGSWMTRGGWCFFEPWLGIQHGNVMSLVVNAVMQVFCMC